MPDVKENLKRKKSFWVDCTQCSAETIHKIASNLSMRCNITQWIGIDERGLIHKLWYVHRIQYKAYSRVRMDPFVEAENASESEEDS